MEHRAIGHETLTGDGEHPATGDPAHPFVQAAARTGERVYRHRPTPIPMVSGTGPVHAPRGQFGVPMIIAGVGYTGSRTHGPDEHICVTDFIAGTHYIAALIDELAE